MAGSMTMNELSGIRATRKRVVPGKQPLKPATPSRVLPVVVLLSCLAGAALLVSRSEAIATYINRPITKVRIENEWRHVSESAVRQELSRYLGAGFFDFDVAGLKRELETQPWIRQASVKRLWPDSIALNLREEVPIARWGQQDLLNQQGEIFTPADIARLGSLPMLSGPEDSQIAVMQQYQLLNELVFPAGLRLTSLSLSPRGSWELTLNEQLDITVGRVKVIPRVNRFLEFYTQVPAVDRAAITSVDLRYDNGLAVAKSEAELSGVAVR